MLSSLLDEDIYLHKLYAQAYAPMHDINLALRTSASTPLSV